METREGGSYSTIDIQKKKQQLYFRDEQTFTLNKEFVLKEKNSTNTFLLTVHKFRSA